MRRIFGALICVLGASVTAAAGPLDTFQSYVNLNILSNGHGSIKGNTLNSALLNLVPVFASMGSWSPSGTFVLYSSALPLPTATAPGGVKAGSAPPHQYMCGINLAGDPIYCQPSVPDINGLGTAAQKNVGSTVVDPGTGNLESVLPIQTVPGAVKAFGLPDVYAETRRSNSGAAMADTFPAASTFGLVNGARIVVANVDTSASDTITAGAGTTFSGSSPTDVVGPGRTIIYGWDAAFLTWRREMNSASSVLSSNNLSDVANPSAALANLGGVPTSATGTSGHAIPYLDGNNSFSGTNAFTVSPTIPTPSLGDNSTKAVNSAFVAANSVTSSALRGYIGGLTLSNDGTSPASMLDVSAGVAQGSDNATLISLGAVTKSTSSPWSAGSGSGGMGNGLTVAANTWYHVCLSYNGGSPDVFFDTSVTCSNKPTSISGSIYRRIGSFKTNGSSQITSFIQKGDHFLWASPVTDVNVTPASTSQVNYPLSVPPGVSVEAQFSAYYTSSAAGGKAAILSPLGSVIIAAAQLFVQVGGQYANGFLSVQTDTSQQVSTIVASTGGNLGIVTIGWFDTRGRWN